MHQEQLCLTDQKRDNQCRNLHQQLDEIIRGVQVLYEFLRRETDTRTTCRETYKKQSFRQN